MTTTQREKRRLEAGRLLLTTDLSKAEISRRLGVTRSAVTQWSQQIKKRRRGLNGLRSRPHSGRPPQLTKANWRRVLALLRRGAIAAGFTTDRWTLERIQELIRREFDISYSKSYLSDKLYVLGWGSGQLMPKSKVPVKQQKYIIPQDYFSSKGWFWNRRNRWYS